MTFYPGQHVACVDDDFSEPDCATPRKGGVYTVQETEFVPAGSIVDSGKRSAEDILFVVLEEFGDGCAWDSMNFRPLDEKRLDVLRAHLAPNPAKEVVRA